jgi:hypothetical protein
VPIAVLLGAWLESLRWRRRAAIAASIWAVVALVFVIGQLALTRRNAPGTNWQMIARETAATPGPLFALDAPEIVFEFYLQRPVVVTPDYQTFVELPEAKYLLIPQRARTNVPANAELREVADGAVAGRRFLLLKRP